MDSSHDGRDIKETLEGVSIANYLYLLQVAPTGKPQVASASSRGALQLHLWHRSFFVSHHGGFSNLPLYPSIAELNAISQFPTEILAIS